MGIQHPSFTLIHELFDFRDFRAGRNLSVVDCKNILILHPSLNPCLWQCDSAAAFIKRWSPSPHPLYPGWPFNLLGQQHVKEVTVCLLSLGLKRICMLPLVLLDPCLCHEKKFRSTHSKARSSNQGHPGPKGSQVTYQLTTDVWVSPAKTHRLMRNNKWFCFKSLSFRMVCYTAIAHWYIELSIPNKWAPWSPEGERTFLKPHLPVTRIHIWQPLTQGPSNYTKHWSFFKYPFLFIFLSHQRSGSEQRAGAGMWWSPSNHKKAKYTSLVSSSLPLRF